MTVRGGEEVLLDVGGQDATEAFEDVGHSDEAREILDGLLVGNLKRVVCTGPCRMWFYQSALRQGHPSLLKASSLDFRAGNLDQKYAEA